jgi:hypothetical protein
MPKTQIEIMEEATAQVALNLFNLKHPELEASDPANKPQMDECVSDTVFVINNFMRITSDIVRKDMLEDQAQ